MNTKNTKSPMCRSWRSGAFTLIELLVVISIIALLIAILLPSLAKSRAAARATMCMMSLRQLTLGLNMYADDFKNQTPLIPTGWGLDLTYLPRFDNSWVGLGQLYAGDYIKSSQVFYCPSATGDANRWEKYAYAWEAGNTSNIVSSYQIRVGDKNSGSGFQFHGGGTYSGHGERIGVLTDWFSDWKFIPITNHGSQLKAPDGYNVAYSDGSVKWMADAGGVIGQFHYNRTYWSQMGFWLNYADVAQ